MIEDYLVWNDLESFAQFCKGDTNGVCNGEFSVKKLIPVELAVDAFKAVDKNGGERGYVLENHQGTGALDILFEGIEKTWDYYLDKYVSKPEPSIDMKPDEVQMLINSLTIGPVMKLAESKRYLAHFVRKYSDSFKIDFCRNFLVSCIFLIKNDKTLSPEHRSMINQISRDRVFTAEHSRPYTLNSITKYLEKHDVNGFYMLDKVTGFSVAYDAALLENENYRLLQDGLIDIADKVAEIRYPYIRKSIYSDFKDQLIETLTEKKMSAVRLREFKKELQEFEMDQINSEINEMMYEFYDLLIAGVCLSGAAAGDDIYAFLRAMYKSMKRECERNRLAEVNEYLCKEQIINNGIVGKNNCTYFEKISKIIYKKMSN